MIRLTIGTLTLAVALSFSAVPAAAQGSDDYQQRMKEHRRKIRAAEKSGDRRALRKARRAALKDARASGHGKKRPQRVNAKTDRKRPERPSRVSKEKPAGDSKLAVRNKSLTPGARARLARARRWRSVSQELGDGAEPSKIPRAARKELKKHAHRIADLRRISVVATQEGNTAVASRARALMARETVRHEKRLKALLKESE